MLKKIVSFILVLTVCIGVFSMPVNAITYKDSFPNTHRNTGGNIADLISVAKTQLGYTELSTKTGKPLSSGQDGGYTKYGAWFGAPTSAWCAFFVAWCANKAGISTSVIPRIGNCASMVRWYSQRGRYFSSRNFTPKTGDLIFYNWKGGSTAKHIGIVTGVSSKYVYVIEGNTGSSNGYRVEAKTRKLTASFIIGYARPDYNDSATYVGSYSFASYAVSKYGSNSSKGNSSSGSYTNTSQLAVFTGTAENISSDSSTLIGRISNSSSYKVTSSGFCFGTSKNSLKKYKTNSSTSKKNIYLSKTVTGLDVAKTYYYCAYAVIKGKTYKGPVYSFTTVDDRPQQLVLSSDYVTLGIGETNEIFSAVLPLEANSEHVEWVSSNEFVAKVNNGLITGLGAGNAVITAKADYGNVSADCTVTVTLSPATDILTENISESEIKITWNDTNLHDIVGYSIYRSDSLDNEFTCIGETHEKSFIDKNLEPGKIYYYRIVCCGISDEFNSSMSEVKKETATLAAPVDIRAYQNGLSLNISWDKVNGAEQYLIYRCDSSKKYTLIAECSSNSYCDNDIRYSKNYSYIICAVNNNLQSKMSAPISFTTQNIRHPESNFVIVKPSVAIKTIDEKPDILKNSIFSWY